MSEKCVFCDKETVVVVPLRFELKICTNCYATFMHAQRFAAINRDLERYTRLKWLEILKVKSVNWSGNKEPKCLIHGQPLKEGTIPDYGFKGYVADCCDYMHLSPASMIEILNVGIEHETKYRLSGKYSSSGGGIVQAITTVLAFPFFWLYKTFLDDDLEEEDLFDSMQYNHRFKDILDPNDEFLDEANKD